ncbi:hypothetical protein KFK09_028663 [Dendrobium nobile]|uniref:Noroxomaritidine/norcraugsodine reductase n=1 Tax=Dendrobium nobile TaxID=94219 RepID=A0A8T3A2J3_DENNO|nr:hypothetical protein KFK09_028663 [Dendrobium nobile]
MASNKPKLEGKVAIITGGASGIGETTTRLFAAHGASVIIADINDSLGHLIAASISPHGRCSFIHCDVRNELHNAAAVAYAITTYGRLDIMFSNAGIAGPMTGVLDLDPADLDQTLAVHVRGTALAIKHAGRAMVAAGTRGSIICHASVSAILGGFAPVAYMTAKHAILGLVKEAAAELGGKGVRVNCVSPYLVATPLVCGATGADVAKVEKLLCTGAILKGAVLRADDVATAVLFLASDDSAFISGHNLVIDGGATVVNTTLAKFIEGKYDLA